MDLAYYIYPVFCGAVIPLVYLWSRDDIRAFLSILSGLVFLAAAVALSHAHGLALRPGSRAALGLLLPLATWIAASNIWSTNTNRSVFESLSLCSILLLCAASAGADKQIVLTALFVPAPLVACWFLVTFQRTKTPGPPFFNTNHLAGYLTLHVFIGYWLATHANPLFALALIPVLIALAFSSCRGAWIGVSAGTVAFLALSAHVSVPGMALPVMFLILPALYIYHPAFRSSMWERWGLYITALQLIRERPFFGWGLQTFVKEQFEASRRVRDRRPAAYMPKDARPQYFPKAHRVHNDFLEITQETGLAGLFLAGMIFYSVPWRADPILSGALIAVLTHALFFFPLRVIKISAPFAVVLGLILQGAHPNPHSGLLMKLVLAASAWQVIRIYLFRRLMGVWYFRASIRHKGGDSALVRKYLDRAVQWDPDNTYYQTQVYLLHVMGDPDKALKAVSRALERYDGTATLWSVLGQYARAALRYGAVTLARTRMQDAMRLFPVHGFGSDLITHLDKLESEICQRSN